MTHSQFSKAKTFLQAEIGWWIMGWPAKGISGLGVLNDNGRKRVPKIDPHSAKKKKKSISLGKLEVEIQKGIDVVHLWSVLRPWSRRRLCLPTSRRSGFVKVETDKLTLRVNLRARLFVLLWRLTSYENETTLSVTWTKKIKVVILLNVYNVLV